MLQAKPRFATFEEYFEWSNDHADHVRYELIDGELIELPPEAEPNTAIAHFLFLNLVQAGVPFRMIKLYQCEIQVRALQPKDAQNRYPDLVVLREEHLALTQKRLTIKLDMPPPQLVVEVVSPGTAASERDYGRKRAQYANIGISEYWIIDPKAQVVTVLALGQGVYVEVGMFRGDDAITSPTFPELRLTPEEVFASAA
ncbi:Uma2 family endonuclease [Myxacorys almedinensis]|uniref:Uma2 family endonuclease n=1 Tax=Myxacorys almedinensis A TaxID=2690445 RepID=A0A8J7ZAQ4_9CYAN|nr:Uma2 family endonuclease [Myxacorys almedinensis]NDJ19468.1 Uma2 family endonuclease [Myxacorys almedinensis A]